MPTASSAATPAIPFRRRRFASVVRCVDAMWKSSPPKGYVGGRFRANWQYGNVMGAGIPMSDLPNIDKTGNASIERIRVGVSAAPASGVHYLCNNLPYARALEDGHSTQAPSGMVALTVVEFNNAVQQAVQS